MSTNEIIGTVICVGVPLVVSFFALVKPIINLNTSITKLNVIIQQLVDENSGINDELKEHEERLIDHEKRIFLIENK